MNQTKNCKLKNCKRPYRAKGYCEFHYKKWRRGELGKNRFKTCHHESCHKPMGRLGMCNEHYEAWLKSRKGAVVSAAAEASPS